MDSMPLSSSLRVDRAGVSRKGDGVIVPGNTTSHDLAVTRAGLRPILVEPDPATYNLDLAHIDKALVEKPKAVIAVHLYGQLAPMAAIQDFCKAHGLLLLEDAAQAHGAKAQGRRAGAFGHAAAFSFYPTKNWARSVTEEQLRPTTTA